MTDSEINHVADFHRIWNMCIFDGTKLTFVQFYNMIKHLDYIVFYYILLSNHEWVNIFGKSCKSHYTHDILQSKAKEICVRFNINATIIDDKLYVPIYSEIMEELYKLNNL